MALRQTTMTATSDAARSLTTRRLSGDDRHALDDAARLLMAGGIVAFPTETVYGLGARALDPDAIARVFAAKGRPSDNPLILHVPSLLAARPLWDVDDDDPAFHRAKKLADRFWPGPLTIVLPATDLVPDSVRAGLPSVAVRVPDHSVARAILLRVGEPVAAPSANQSGRVSPTTADHVLETLDGEIDAVVDGGACTVGLESSVVDVTTDVPVLLRPGSVSLSAIREVLPMTMARVSGQPTHKDASPGLRHRHYAPDIPVIVFVDDHALAPHFAFRDRAILAPRDIYDSARQSAPVVVDDRGIIDEVLSANPDEFGTALYAALYRLERRRPNVLVVARPPADDAWRAVTDRLSRAVNRDEVPVR